MGKTLQPVLFSFCSSLLYTYMILKFWLEYNHWLSLLSSSVNCVTLFLNLLACLAFFTTASNNGVDFGLSILWLILFAPCSFLCWYRPVYKAFRWVPPSWKVLYASFDPVCGQWCVFLRTLLKRHFFHLDFTDVYINALAFEMFVPKCIVYKFNKKPCEFIFKFRSTAVNKKKNVW